VPTQRRSRERMESLLSTAAALIAAKGSDAMRMSEVAEKAGVSIGSLYQYFPDKAAILRTLAERYDAQGRECIRVELDAVRDMPGLRAALGRLTDAYYRMFLAEPVMRDIWSGTQADKSLQDMDLAENRALGGMLAEVLARLQPRADRAELETSAFLTMHLVGATVRLAITVDPAEGEALVATFKRMMLKEILPE
jgi:AcrR family transcriptional regulator